MSRKSGHAGRSEWCQGAKSLRGRPNRERRYQRRELLSLNQLCQRNCCGLRAEPCEITTLTRAGPGKFIASSRAPRRSFGILDKEALAAEGLHYPVIAGAVNQCVGR